MALKNHFLQALARRLAPPLYHGVSRALFATCRVETVGREYLERGLAAGPLISACWHYAIFFHLYQVRRQQLEIAPAARWVLMVSASDDAELLSGALQMMNAELVRGSRSRGGGGGFETDDRPGQEGGQRRDHRRRLPRSGPDRPGRGGAPGLPHRRPHPPLGLGRRSPLEPEKLGSQRNPQTRRENQLPLRRAPPGPPRPQKRATGRVPSPTGKQPEPTPPISPAKIQPSNIGSAGLRQAGRRCVLVVREPDRSP